MNKYQKIFVWIFLLMTIGFLSLYVYVKANGKPLLEKHLSKVFDQQVSLGDVRFIFPIGVRAVDINVGQFFIAEEAKVKIGIPFKLKDEYLISSLTIVKPKFAIGKSENNKIVFVENEEKVSTKKIKPKSVKKVKKKNKYLVNSFEIIDGEVELLDPGNLPTGLHIKDVKVRATNFAYPLRPIKTRFKLSGMLDSKDQPFYKNRAHLNGWIDFIEKDMEGELKVVDDKGAAGFKAELVSVKNDLTIKGTLRIKHLVNQREEPKEEDAFSMDNLILGALKSSGVDVNVDFSTKTELDNFKLNRKITYSGNFNYDKNKETVEDIKKIGKEFYESNIKKIVPKETVEQGSKGEVAE